MKEFLDFMVGGLNLTPEPTILSVVISFIFNAGIRFAALFAVVYVVVRAYLVASGG